MENPFIWVTFLHQISPTRRIVMLPGSIMVSSQISE